MRRRHALPSLILMTDQRQGEALWAALAALPRGAAVIVRDYERSPAERRTRFERVRRIARRRGLVVLLAGTPAEAVRVRADGCHGPAAGRRHPRPMLRSMAAHDRCELIAARRAGADLVLVSPVHATRSHPGARYLGRVRIGLMLGRGSRERIVALGGMTAGRARALSKLGVKRWAAIDGLTPAGQHQKRKAVPI